MSTSANQRLDGLLVSRIDPLQTIDSIESAICREDRVDSTVDCQGGEDGVLGIEALVSLEEVDSPLNVIGLYRMPPGERRDASRSFCRTPSVPGSPRSLVRELLKQVDAGLALKIPQGGEARDLAARLPIGMLST